MTDFPRLERPLVAAVAAFRSCPETASKPASRPGGKRVGIRAFGYLGPRRAEAGDAPLRVLTGVSPAASGGCLRAGLPEGVKKRFRRFEIRRVEPLGKAVINRLQDCQRLGGAVLIVQQAGEARRGAQLPR